MKKISIIALAAIAAAFTTYKIFIDLAESLEKADTDWDEEDDREFI